MYHVGLSIALSTPAGHTKNLYLKVHRAVPENINVLKNLGIVWLDLGKLQHQIGETEKGQDYIEKTLGGEPSYPIALNNLAVIYSERRKTASAWLIASLTTSEKKTVHGIPG